MNFKKVFRGYDPKQVDAHVENLMQKHEQIRLAQKQYLEELTEENYQLRQQVKQFHQDEQAIAKSLVESQKLADELKNDAVRFSELVLTRAKVFYATWSAYSQTLIATLDPKEVVEFNKIMAKIETIINAYEGQNIATESRQIVAEVKNQQVASSTADLPQNQGQNTQPQAETPLQTDSETPDLMPSGTTMGVYANPIGKVEQAANVIDLRELAVTDLSLAELCMDLGLISKKPD